MTSNESGSSNETRDTSTETIEQSEPANQKINETFENRFTDLMLTNFNDENVKECNGPINIENGDQEIYNNILFGLYSNMVACYLKLKNIREA